MPPEVTTQLAAGRLDTVALRGEADVALGEPVGELRDRKPATVVLDHEHQLAVALEQADGQLGRLRVLDDVREQLPRRREDELLAGVAVRDSAGRA